jgi:hypothetical protein
VASLSLGAEVEKTTIATRKLQGTITYMGISSEECQFEKVVRFEAESLECLIQPQCSGAVNDHINIQLDRQQWMNEKLLLRIWERSDTPHRLALATNTLTLFGLAGTGNLSTARAMARYCMSF